MKLSNDQEKALDKILAFVADDTTMEMALEGFSGTGKSTLTKHILDAIENQGNVLNTLLGSSKYAENFHLTATTNKAAEVLAQKTGRNASTIHRLLGLRLMTNYSTGATYLKQSGTPNLNPNSLIVIDEASMVDEELLQYIHDTCKSSKILYILDPDQLAPIGAGKCPVSESVDHKAKLDKIMRNAGPIALLGQEFREAIHTGIFPDIQLTDEIIHVDGPSFKKEAEDVYKGTYHVDDCRILAWRNATVKAYNKAVRSMYTDSPIYKAGETLVSNNPILSPIGEVLIGTEQVVTLNHVDKVDSFMFDIEGRYATSREQRARMFIPNDPLATTNALQIAKGAKDWHTYYGIKEKVADMRPIHASTVHKSQGSTYEKVMIDLSDIGKNPKWEEVARMLYVGITRAKGKVVFYGELPYKYTSRYGTHL